MKSGFLATARNSPTVYADLLQGKGTRVMRYGEEGDPLRALEARFEKLEAALRELRKKRD